MYHGEAAPTALLNANSISIGLTEENSHPPFKPQYAVTTILYFPPPSGSLVTLYANQSEYSGGLYVSIETSVTICNLKLEYLTTHNCAASHFALQSLSSIHIGVVLFNAVSSSSVGKATQPAIVASRANPIIDKITFNFRSPLLVDPNL